MKRTALKRTTPLRRSKYGVAKKTDRTRLGELYDSKLEMRYAAQLELLRHAIHPRDKVIGIARQVPIRLEVAGHLICVYRCDFEVAYADGRTELHEVKGYPTETWAIKEKLFRALYPHRTLRIIRKV